MKKMEKGFTLIELLVSLSIFSVLILIFFNTIEMSINSNMKNEKDIKAMNIAQSEIENIRSQLKSNTHKVKTVMGKIISLDGTQIEDERTIDVLNQTDIDKYRVIISVNKVSNSLYDVKVNVASKQSNFSQKKTTVTTQIHGKTIK